MTGTDSPERPLGSIPTPAEQASATRPRFTNVVRLDQVDSTNRYCADAAATGAPEGLVVVAREQTAGRGRRGRTWLAPRDSSLLCSVLFRPSFGSGEWHLLASIVGLSALDAIDAPALTTLKWPNDVLLNGRKVAGVLGEGVESESALPPAVVVGIGINRAWSLRDSFAGSSGDVHAALEGATTIRAEIGGSPSIDELLRRLIAGIESRYRRCDDAPGRRSVMDEYRSRCATVGLDVQIDLSHGSIVGRAIGISDDGRLMIHSAGETRSIEVGDVVHLRTMDGR